MRKTPRIALVLLLAGAASCADGTRSTPLVEERTEGLEVSGAITSVHDPAIIRVGDTYLLFATTQERHGGGLIHIRSSRDLSSWTRTGAVLPAMPDWARAAVPGTQGIWAPDIYQHEGQYRLYYSISTFGENRSVIGMATADTLDPAAPETGWTDRGAVVESVSSDDYNAIDPAPFIDAEGRHWLSFGSFWSGIKMVELDPATGKRLASNDTLYSLASRPTTPGSVEAPYIIRHDGFYYLFVSFDFCCRGADSTYNTVVGRSRSPTGPYVDAEGRPMLEGGGTPVLTSGRGENSRFVGRGHVSILQDEDGQDYIVYHAYDTSANGTPTLRIRRITWTPDGWPVAR